MSATMLKVKVASEPNLNFTLKVNLELALDKGVIGVFGQSGSGKSTLLKAIAGVAEINGHVVFKQQDCSLLNAQNRPVVLQFQNPSLFGHLNVINNLKFVERYAQYRTDINYTLEEVIEWCAIAHLLNKPVQSLSGGEIQRVALARTLLSKKPLVLLDEPFSALDWAGRCSLLQRLVWIQTQYSVYFILVSHSLTELGLCCSDIIHVDQGQVIAHGSTQEMINTLSHQHDQVCFSILNCTFNQPHPEEGLAELLLGDTAIYVKQDSRNNDYKHGDSVTVAIDANKVSLSKQNNHQSSILNVIEGKVFDIQQRQVSVLIGLKIQNQALWAEISLMSFKRMNIKIDDSLCAMFKAL